MWWITLLWLSIWWDGMQICRNMLWKWIVRLNWDQFGLRSAVKLVWQLHPCNVEYYKFIYSVFQITFYFSRNSILKEAKFKFSHESFSPSILVPSIFIKKFEIIWKIIEQMILFVKFSKRKYKNKKHLSKVIVSIILKSEGFSIFSNLSHHQRNYLKQLER